MIPGFSAALRLIAYVLWTLVMLPPYLAALAVRNGYRPLARFYWWVVARWVLKARLRVVGRPSQERPLLLVSNHASYLDIIVLGALVKAGFVSKAEVRTWPGIGFLAVIARTVFVERRPSATARHRDAIKTRMAEGEPLILFPEGTSNDGNRVLPFKSALFNAAEGEVNGQPIHVQPVSIAYTRNWGLPLGYMGRPAYAWYGDMELAPHLWDLLCLGTFDVDVTFHPTATVADHGSRKALSRHCETVIRAGVEASLRGRPLTLPTPPLPAPSPPPASPPETAPDARAA